MFGAPVSARGSVRLLQRKEIRVTLDSNTGPRNNGFRLEVGDDGQISGASLFQQLLTAVPPEVFAKYMIADSERSSYISVRVSNKPVLCDDTMHEIVEMATVTVSVNFQKMAGDALEAGGVDADLITRSEAANECIIGCYLLSSPGNEQALNEQQSLDRVITALETEGSYTLVLLDPNFKGSGEGQIIDFLIQKYRSEIVVETDSSSDVTTHKIKTFRGKPAKVKIAYVARNVNKATQSKMTRTRWYCDER